MVEPSVKQLGPYRVLSILGKGGMATVYKAEDGRDGRVVAVKMMSAALTERKDMALRFRREFRAIRRLGHPNIVQVLDGGEVDGRFFFAMEFVDGVDLAKYFGLRVAGKSVRPEVLAAPGRVRKVLEVAAQISDALLYIHGERIVHRDMKPTNVFVTREGIVKLMDFGIAKELDQTAALTRHGSFLGTAYYTAPEQIKASKDLDGRADLYALGIILYESLVGRVPFYSDNTVDVLRMHILEPPVPPRDLNPSLPADASAVVTRLLAKDPHERYRDARELLEAVVACADYPRDQATREWKAPAVRARPAVAAGLVGRDKELARLVDAMDAATVGQPVLAAITGPLGIGKTRLAQALEEHVRAASGLFLSGRYPDDRAGPYLAWRDVLGASVSYLMGYGIPYTIKVAGDHGRILRSIAPAFDRVAGEKPPPARLDPEEDRLRLFEAVLGYFHSLSRLVPVAIFLDDLQWAYEADFELIAFLLRGLVSAPAGKGSASGCNLLLVVAYRDDEVPPDHPLRRVIMGRPESLRFVEVRLAPFAEGEVRDLLVALAGGEKVLGGTDEVVRMVRAVIAETAGNPYHVEEMAKSFVGTSVVRVSKGDRATTPAVAVPRFLEAEATRADPRPPVGNTETTRRHVGDLLRARMRGLSEPARRVLCAASVIAEGIDFETLAALTESDDDDLLDLLDELLRERFLIERDRGDLFDFQQKLVKDAVYGAMAEEERRRLHGRMVAIFEPRVRDNADGFAALLALHAERAGDQTLAARSYLDACDAALLGNRVDEAERYLGRARELGIVSDHGGSTAEIALENRRGNIMLARGEPAEASRIFEAVMARAKDKGDSHGAADAARRLGIAYARAGNHVLAIANLEWALSVALRAGDLPLQADARDGLGATQLVRGNFDLALEQMREALDLRKRLGDRVGVTRALAGAARALSAKGELHAALKMQRDALAFSLNLAETAGAARGHAEIGDLCRQLGKPDEARDHLGEALVLARKAGAREVEVSVLSSSALLLMGRGDLMEARRAAEEAIGVARATGDAKLLAGALMVAGDEALLRYDLAGAKVRYEESRSLAMTLGDRVVRAASARALARVAQRSKALDSARAYLGEALATHAKIGARMALHEDRIEEGLLAVAEAVVQTSSVGGPQSERGRSMLQPALEAVEAALPDLAREGAVPLEAYALLAVAEIKLALRQGAEARRVAQQAHDKARAAGQMDIALRALIVAGRALFLTKETREALQRYRAAIEILKTIASRLTDRSERLLYLSEPDRRAMVEEAKVLSSLAGG